MKLSEAIRKGSEGIRQGFNNFIFFLPDSKRVLEACALGAAVVANYSIEEMDDGELDFWKKLTDLYPEIASEEPTVVHPISQHLESLYQVIISLNDTHRWSSKRIADWVESVGY